MKSQHKDCNTFEKSYEINEAPIFSVSLFFLLTRQAETSKIQRRTSPVIQSMQLTLLMYMIIYNTCIQLYCDQHSIQ